jgi:predicted Zn-dependent protease
MTRKQLPALVLAVAVLAAGCSTVPITGRRQLSLVSDQEILSSSLTEYKSFMGTAKVSGNRVQSAQVVRVGRRIADATERYLRENGLEKEVSGFAWEFNLVQDKQVNAFCMPGGKIVVYTGLMALVSSDDELAVVLGHEVAHAVAKHANERMSQQLLASAGAQAVGYATKERSAAVQSAAAGVYGLGAQVGALLPFSRKHESEADYMGLALMSLAGYDPDCAPVFWRKMAAAGSGKTPELLSSHPSDASRVAALEKALPEIKSKYRPAP